MRRAAARQSGQGAGRKDKGWTAGEVVDIVPVQRSRRSTHSAQKTWEQGSRRQGLEGASRQTAQMAEEAEEGEEEAEGAGGDGAEAEEPPSDASRGEGARPPPLKESQARSPAPTRTPAERMQVAKTRSAPTPGITGRPAILDSPREGQGMPKKPEQNPPSYGVGPGSGGDNNALARPAYHLKRASEAQKHYPRLMVPRMDGLYGFIV